MNRTEPLIVTATNKAATTRWLAAVCLLKQKPKSGINSTFTVPMVLRCRIYGTTESVMVAYTHKYAKV